MGMGDDQAQQVFPAVDDPGRIRDDDVYARQGLVGESNAEIDHQPFAVIAVEIEIHPDFAGAAERQKQQLVASIRHG